MKNIKPLRDFILVEYKPETNKQLESGIYVPNEDAFDFLELSVLKAGFGCKYVKDGDTVYIRKESLFQAEVDQGFIYQTKEKLVLKLNGQTMNKNILIRPIIEETTKGGIILLPQSEESPIQKGEVIQIGGDVEDVNLGDVVLIGKHSGLKDGDNYFVHEDEVLGVIV